MHAGQCTIHSVGPLRSDTCRPARFPGFARVQLLSQDDAAATKRNAAQSNQRSELLRGRPNVAGDDTLGHLRDRNVGVL
jgi:hypothetical protein